MKRPSRLDYAYAVGRVRALERYLVSSAVFKEAADEKDAAAAIKTIFDAGNFLDEMTDVRTPKEMDLFLAKEERQLLKTLSEIFIEKEFLRIMTHELGAPLTAFSIAQKLDYAFISDYFRHRIDLGNLKLFFRTKYLGRTKEWVENVLLTGGFYSPDLLLDNFELSYTEIAEKLHATPYQKVWEEAVGGIEEKETFVVLERGIDDYLIHFLRKAKFFVFGPEPVFAFGMAKRRELGLIRMLVTGKMNHIPSEILKERLGDTYA